MLSLGVSSQTIASEQQHFEQQRSLCTAKLIANNPDSRINFRSGPGTQYQRLGYGLVGDQVYILASSPPEADYEKDSQGYIWYRVGFPESGAKGWMRADLLQRSCRYD